MKKISIKDIANMTGASPSTVSFVLNGKAKEMRISEARAAKIIAIAKKAGYHPNQLAVSLRTGQSNIIGLIAESIAGNFFGSLAKIIEDEAEVYGYKIVYCSTENDSIKGCEMIKMLSQRQVDGYLITPTPGMETAVEELLAHKKPVVLMDSYFENEKVPYVLADNSGGIAIGMKYIIAKGYRRIGFVTIDLALPQMKDRLEGYTKILKQKKIPYSKKLLLQIAYDCPKAAAIAQISAYIKSAKPEVLFFATNYLGVLGLESIQQLGLRIPADIAMICFDDHDLFRLYPPGITSIQQPVEEIAKTAIQLLMHQLGKNKTKFKKKQLQLAAKLIERGST